jgi:predicted nucleotidyltransferase
MSVKTDGILIKSDRDPLFGRTPEGLVDALRTRLKGRVQAAYFFGGFATGRLTPHSDIDLILVQPTTKPFLERGEDFLDLYDIVPAIDLLIYTPEEFARLTGRPTVGFWKSVTASLNRFL